jgi:uncharacterized protein YggU (UPF0235/DUF167 family)
MKTRLTLKIRASAPKTEFTERFGDATWKLRVAAPPVDGKANQAIIRYLAKIASVPASAIRIVAGFTATSKIVEIEGIDSATLERAILESHGPRTHTKRPAPGEA